MIRKLVALLLILCLCVPAFALATEDEEDVSIASVLDGTADDNADAAAPDAAAAVPVDPAAPVYEVDGSIILKLTFTGDFTIGDNLQSKGKSIFEKELEKQKGDLNFPFRNFRDILLADDLTVINFEGTLTTAGRNQSKLDNQFLFRADPAYAAMLRPNGVECVSLENNHVLDMGEDGLAETKLNLQNAGVNYYCEAEPLVFTDRLNHASLHHAFKVAEVRQIRFRHADLTHLAELLDKHAHSDQPKFIVAESVFGMDGDCIDVAGLVSLAQAHQAMLYLDEAHATGVLGERGYGLTADQGGRVDVAMGTFSKALGGSGAYIACKQVVKDYLINTCTGFIYSTALSPMVVAAMHKAWTLLPSLDAERQRLQTMAAEVRTRLHAMGLDTGLSTTHIVPVILGDERRTLQARDKLQARGINVSAVRPPTVPPNTARLRMAFGSHHTPEQIDALIEALRDV